MSSIPTEIMLGGCGHDAAAMSVDEARARIDAVLRPPTLVQRVPLRDALDRVLAEPILSPLDVPAHDNSAMDGYAVRAADLEQVPEAPFKVVGEAFAGHPFAGTLQAGEAVRIMTGGVIPAGADTVVMQERARREGDRVWLDVAARRGEHVRRRGEDLAAGDAVLDAGRRITPADLGLLASLGLAELPVYRRLRVAFFSTGDELRSVGEPLAEGEIYDSNRYTLYGMLRHRDVDLLDMGVVRDEREALAQALDVAAANADVVITSGGVSVGEADFITELLRERGRIGFWTVNIKPGRPLAFGHLGKAVFFGLPGNPVSVMVTFYQLVLPALQRLQGSEPQPRLQLRARALSDIRKKSGRREFQRGVLTSGIDGVPEVRLTGSQGSGILRSMSTANCFVVLPEESGDVAAGSWVTVEPFAGLF